MFCWRFGLATIDLHTRSTWHNHRRAVFISNHLCNRLKEKANKFTNFHSNVKHFGMNRIKSHPILLCKIDPSLLELKTKRGHVRCVGREIKHFVLMKRTSCGCSHTPPHTLGLTHALMLTSLSLNHRQPTELGCDVHQCAACSLSPGHSDCSSLTMEACNLFWVRFSFLKLSTADTTCRDITFIYFASRERTCCLSPSGPLWILVCRTACNIPSFWYSTHRAELKICQGTWRHTAAGGKASS